jgi:hypothetical protein
LCTLIYKHETNPGMRRLRFLAGGAFNMKQPSDESRLQTKEAYQDAKDVIVGRTVLT